MSQRYNNLVNFSQSLTDKGATSKAWYFFWQALWQGIAPGPEVPITPTGSPFVYQAPSRGFLLLQGGTVSFVSFSRDGSTFYNTGVTAGPFPMSKSDALSITYSGSPTMTFVSQ